MKTQQSILFQDRPISHLWLKNNPGALQRILAKNKNEIPLCLCRSAGLPLYIAKNKNKYYLNVYPDTGVEHELNCMFHRVSKKSVRHLSNIEYIKDNLIKPANSLWIGRSKILHYKLFCNWIDNLGKNKDFCSVNTPSTRSPLPCRYKVGVIRSCEKHELYMFYLEGAYKLGNIYNGLATNDFAESVDLALIDTKTKQGWYIGNLVSH